MSEKRFFKKKKNYFKNKIIISYVITKYRPIPRKVDIKGVMSEKRFFK